MKRFVLALLLASLAAAAPTHVVGVLRNADGTTVSGSILITWDTFTASNVVYHAGTVRLNVVNGALDAHLQPTYYSITWGGIGKNETTLMQVPASSGAVNLASCLTDDPAIIAAAAAAAQRLPLAQLAASGASAGQVMTWTGSIWAPANFATPISAVTGLQTALTAGTTATTAEATARAAADATLTTSIASEATARAAADASEVTARNAAIAAATPGYAFSINLSQATPIGYVSISPDGTTHQSAVLPDGMRIWADSGIITEMTALSITGSTHGLATAKIRLSCWDASNGTPITGPQILSVDASSFDTRILPIPWTPANCRLTK